MLREASERELCANNVLVYGLSESLSPCVPRRINDDKITVEQTFGQHLNIIPNSTMELVRLGKVHPDYVHPLKIIFLFKDDPINLLRGFNEV